MDEEEKSSFDHLRREKLWKAKPKNVESRCRFLGMRVFKTTERVAKPYEWDRRNAR
jgi:hypothetical protein